MICLLNYDNKKHMLERPKFTCTYLVHRHLELHLIIQIFFQSLLLVCFLLALALLASSLPVPIIEANNGQEEVLETAKSLPHLHHYYPHYYPHHSHRRPDQHLG